MNSDEKRLIADAILQVKGTRKVPAMTEFPPRKNIDVRSKVNIDPTQINPPSLAPLVDELSLFLMSCAGLDGDQIEDWLQVPVSVWAHMSGYKKFLSFAKIMVVVNDPAERSVGNKIVNLSVF